MKQPFELVVARHGDAVLRVCWAVIGFPDAEDAWSDTFLAAMRSYPDLPADANVEAWLVTIAHRKCIDIARSRQRRAVPIENLPDGTSTLGVPGTEDGTGDAWKAMRSLPPKQRQAVAYHHIAGMPYKEVADIIGGSAAAARRAAADGIKAVRLAVGQQPRTAGTVSAVDGSSTEKGAQS